MSSTSGSGFELSGPFYAPPREWGAASSDIKNYLIDGKKVWLEIERLLRDGVTENDRQWLNDALSEISIYTSNPDTLPTPADKTTMEEYKKRIRAFMSTIDAAKAALPSTPEPKESPERSKPRNSFEVFLIKNRFPEEKLILPDGSSEEEYKENWRKKMAFYLTVWFEERLGDGNFVQRSLNPLGEHKIDAEDTHGGSFATEVRKLSQQGLTGIDNPKEAEIAKKTIELLGYQIDLYDLIVDGYNKYYQGNQSTSTIADIYSISKEKTTATTDILFDTLDSLPPLIIDKETLKEDTVPFGKRLLESSREIIKRGRRTKVVGGVTHLDHAAVRWTPKHEMLEKNPFAKIRFLVAGKVEEQWKELRGNPAAGKDKKTIYPHTASSEAESTERNFVDFAKTISIDNDPDHEWIGKFTAIFSHHMMAWANFEDAVQDMRPSSTSPQGRPVGLNQISRYTHYAEYMSKVLTELGGRGGSVNVWGIGTFRKMVLGMFDCLVYKGTSVTERILDETVVSWEDKPAEKAPDGTITKPAVKGVYNKRYRPADFDRHWKVAVQRTAQAFGAIMEGIKDGSLVEIAEFKLAEGKVTLKSATIEALVTFHRLITEYRTFTEASGSLAINTETLLEDAEKAGELVGLTTDGEKRSYVLENNLSNDFCEIRILDRNGKDLSEIVFIDEDGKKRSAERFFTRVADFYEITPPELSVWLQHPDDEKLDRIYKFDEGGWRIGKQSGWNRSASGEDFQRPTNKRGIKRNVLFVQLDTDFSYLKLTKDEVQKLSDTQKSEYEKAVFCKDRNNSRGLLERYIAAHMHLAILRQQLKNTEFSKQDWMGFFMFYSAAYKRSYAHGGERGPFLKIVHELGQGLHLNILTAETPDILGPANFTVKEMYAIINEGYAGVKMTAQEIIAELKNAQKLVGDLFGGN